MANIKSIHSACNSIMRFLHHAYEAAPVPDGAADTFMPDAYPCHFRVLSSGELKAGVDFGTTLSLYLYRVLINEHVRSQPVARSGGRSSLPLFVDLHFLLTIWAESAVAEQTILAWAIQHLHQFPILDVSSLTKEGGWQPDEIIQIVPAELSNEDLMRIWDALAPDYRLSFPYIARVVRIDVDEGAEGAPVVATRYQFTEKGGE
jgi:hypothetical protein